MRVLIIYFSQTGNTEKIGKKIQEGIIASGNECSLVKIKQAEMNQILNYDLIGIGTPTFYYREPKNVQNFLQGLNKVENKHFFLFRTHGAIPGNTFYYMAKTINEKGGLIIAHFDSYASSSLQFYPEVMHTAGHPDEIDLEAAKQFGRHLPDLSRDIAQGNQKPLPSIELIEDTWWERDSRVINSMGMGNMAPKFHINIEKCTKCLLCQEECPVNAINIEADPPEIQNEGCLFCFYCEKLCPVGAIEADWTMMKAAVKGNLRKYVKELKQAEKDGKFRPLVEYENIK